MMKKEHKSFKRIFFTLMMLILVCGVSVAHAEITLEQLKQVDPVAARAVEGLRALNLPSGTEIVFFGEAPKVLGVRTVKGELERLTGIKVIAEEAPSVEVIPKVLRDALTGAGLYDIPTPISSAIADLVAANYLYPVDEFVRKYDPELEDFPVPLNEIWTSFAGKIYGLPMDGDAFVLFYRKDMLNDPAEKDAFKAKYGYELKVPKTYKEFRDVVEFFTRPEQGFYGYTAWRSKGWVYNWFFHRLGSAGGFYFDKNMNAAINSPAGVRALENMKDLNQFMPPGYMGKGYVETVIDFITRKAFCVITWGALGVRSARDPSSEVVGKVGYAVPPGFEVNGKVNQYSELAGGYTMLVSKYSKHPEAAYLVTQYLTSSYSLFQMCEIADAATEPIRLSTFADPRLQKLFPGADEWQAAQKASLKVGWPDLIIPAFSEYSSKLEIEISNYMVGKKTAQEALDKAAQEWNRITQRMGKNRQRKFYKTLMEAMNLWKNIPD